MRSHLSALLGMALLATGCTTYGGGGGSYVDPGEVAPVVSYDTLTLGTGVKWLSDPDDALALAQAEGKLLLVVHLSGDFEAFEST
ncbi:hypothetical protein OAX78_01995 [Planctomycetota bacterium]|nr:hypothetical protein [Planctomycetota bacterium]